MWPKRPAVGSSRRCWWPAAGSFFRSACKCARRPLVGPDVYAVQSSSSLRRALRSGRLRQRVGGTVLLLGTCSLLTDISSEMVSAILPVYLVTTLGFSPLQYGVVDGIYQGASSLVA